MIKRVYLTNPPLNMAETPLQYHRPMVPLGLGYLGAVLEDAFTGGRWSEYVRDRLCSRAAGGYPSSGRVAVRDNMLRSFYGTYSFDDLVADIERFADGVAPDELLIGLSVLSDGMRAARSMLTRLRRLFPVAKIAVGGPHATFFPYDFYECRAERRGPLADFVVRNEAERVILGIVAGDLDTAYDLERKVIEYGMDAKRSDWTDPDYVVIDGGQVGRTTVGAGFGALDSLPIPAYFLFTDESGRLPYEPDRRYGLAAPAVNINSSRGCPHKCTFCTIPKLAPGYRTMSANRMIDTVQFLTRDYGVQSVFFREDNFTYGGGTVPGDRWADIELFAEALLDSRIPLKWAIEARADNLTAARPNGGSRIELLRRAGLSGVYVGVESGADAMLRLYGKGADTNAMSAAVSACHDHGVAVVATACYSDSDLLLRARYPLIRPDETSYVMDLVAQREAVLNATRGFMDRHNVPEPLREEYVLVGIPVSTTYEVLDSARAEYPFLVEHVDPDSRYIYPKGFRWWADKVYEAKRQVRPYFGFNFVSET